MTPDILPVSIAVLAGGMSTRFESGDKALAELDGAPLIQRAASVFAPLTDDLIFQIRADQERLEAAIGSMGAACGEGRVSHDDPCGAGPLGAIMCALRAARHQYVMIVGVDLPNVDGHLVEALAERVDDEPDVVVPGWPDGKLEPLCAIYSKELEADIAGIIGDADDDMDVTTRGRSPALGLHRAIDTFRGKGRRVVTVDIPGFLADYGLGEDYFANFNRPRRG
jgi:molybdopterin-guanine dinucleotide biosynthesis protein A